MKIHVKSGLYGARTAIGIGVIIDVFRASSTICAILSNNAEYIIPAKFMKNARQMKKDNPEYVLIGERRGVKPKDFDYGNSPYEVSKLHLDHKIVILRSSAGSHAILEAFKSPASEVLIGSFLNAGAIVDYIREREPSEVTLIAVGTLEIGPFRKAVEDQLCAHFIQSLLNRKKANLSRILKEIKSGEGAQRLRSFGQDKDLEICMKYNLYPNILPKATTFQECRIIRA